MRKRINSEQKYSYAELHTIAVDFKHPYNPEQLSNHPSRPPKAMPNKDRNRPEVFQKELSVVKVKQFSDQLMKELRRLILNQVDSGDRLYNYLTPTVHKNILKLYQQDRQRLLDYLNRLIMRQVKGPGLRCESKGKQSKRSLDKIIPRLNTQDQIEERTDEHQTTRKRSSSQLSLGHKQFSSEMEVVNKRLKKLQNQRKISPRPCRKARKVSAEQVSSPDFNTLELVIRQSQSLLKKVYNGNTIKQDYILMEKSEVHKLIKNGGHLLAQFKINSQKCRQQVMAEISNTNKLKFDVQRLLKDKQRLLAQKQLILSKMQHNHKTGYEQMKQKVNRLYSELQELISELDSKDEFIEDIRAENNNLMSDLEGMQELNRMVKVQQKMLADYVTTLEERLMMQDAGMAQQQQELFNYKQELMTKDRELDDAKAELLARQIKLNSVPKQNQHETSVLKDKMVTLASQKQQLSGQNILLLMKIKQVEKQLADVNYQKMVLDMKVKGVRSEADKAKMNNQYMQEHLQKLKSQNIQLHSTVNQKQEEIQEMKGIIKAGIKDQHFSVENYQSRTISQDLFEQQEFQQENHCVSKTYSEVQRQKIQQLIPVQKHPESQADFGSHHKHHHKHNNHNKIYQIIPQADYQSVYNAQVSQMDTVIQQPVNQVDQQTLKYQAIAQEDISEVISNQKNVVSLQGNADRLEEIDQIPEERKVSMKQQTTLPMIVLSDSIDRAQERMQVHPEELIAFKKKWTVPCQQNTQNQPPSKSSSQVSKGNLYIRHEHRSVGTPRSARSASERK